MACLLPCACRRQRGRGHALLPVVQLAAAVVMVVVAVVVVLVVVLVVVVGRSRGLGLGLGLDLGRGRGRGRGGGALAATRVARAFPAPRPPAATAAAFALRATLALEPLGVRGLQLCQQRGLRRCSRSGRALPQPDPLGPDAVRPKGCTAQPTLGRNSSCTVAAPVAAFISIGQLVVTGGTTSGPAGCSARARLFASACSAAALRSCWAKNASCWAKHVQNTLTR